MYKNVGGKIKSVVRVLTIVAFIVSILSSATSTVSLGLFVSYKCGGAVWVWFATLTIFILSSVISCTICWVCSFALYAYGQLVENSDKIVVEQEKLNKRLDQLLSQNKELIALNKSQCNQNSLSIEQQKAMFNFMAENMQQ